VDLLLRAAARLAAEIPALRVLIVGDGPALPELRALAEELRLSERVVFTGAVPAEDIPVHVAAMDVAVQPNVTDYASPIKLFEYLAVGRAVVAPRKENILEVVEEGKTALLYSPGDVADMSANLRRLHEDPGLRARLGRSGHQLIEEREYHWLGNARKVVEIVRRA
jgi:glycosyltransferase involved in cell wall biosynthesis